MKSLPNAHLRDPVESNSVIYCDCIIRQLVLPMIHDFMHFSCFSPHSSTFFPPFRLAFFRIQITVLHSLVPVSNGIAFEWPFIKVNRDCFLIPSGWRNLWNGCQTAIVSIQMHLNVIQLKYFRGRGNELQKCKKKRGVKRLLTISLGIRVISV